jgi:hypothetical protein
MVDPIDPVSVKLNAGVVAEPPKVASVALAPDQHNSETAASQASVDGRAMRDDSKPPLETTPRPGFEVHIDGATLRLYSEMRDPDTRRVIQRIPTGYQPKFEPPEDYKPTEFDT